MINKSFNKNWHWFLLILIPVVAIFVRIFMPTGTWECYNGQWVKRGNPKFPKPETVCLVGDGELDQLITEAELIFNIFNSGNSIKINSETESATVILQTPSAGSLVSSPLAVTGLVPDDWFYQGQLLITLEDSDRQVFSKHFATKQPGETIIPNHSLFSAWIDFETVTKSGYLVVHKNNLSITEAKTDLKRWPLQFK